MLEPLRRKFRPKQQHDFAWKEVRADKSTEPEVPATRQPPASLMELKDRVRAGILKKTYDVADYYKTTGWWQAIARHRLFDSITLAVISLNALWIGVDTDLNDADTLLQAAPVFQVADNAFCSYFFVEWLVRFNAFRRKRDCFRDGWFVFDSILVFLMVVETWGMTAYALLAGPTMSAGLSNVSLLRMFRLLRLSRMTRMVRLLRRMPELVILAKSMAAAIRSLVFTALLLGVLLYVFGITFRQLVVPGSALATAYFPSLPKAMYSLLLHGTFLDNLGTVAAAILGQSQLMAGLFWVFVVLSSLTVMNMLIGILCEVVSKVSEAEREALLVSFVKEKMETFMLEVDEDHNGKVSPAELLAILSKPDACRILSDVGVDVVGLIDQIDIIFAHNNHDHVDGDDSMELDFNELMELVLSQRSTCKAMVKDIVDLRRFVKSVMGKTNESVEQVIEKVDDISRGAQLRQDRKFNDLLTGHPVLSGHATAGPAPADGPTDLDSQVRRMESKLANRTQQFRELATQLVSQLDADIADVRRLRSELEAPTGTEPPRGDLGRGAERLLSRAAA